MINFVPIQTILVLSIGMKSEGNSLCFRKVKSRNKVDHVFTMPRFHITIKIIGLRMKVENYKRPKTICSRLLAVKFVRQPVVPRVPKLRVLK